MKLLRNDIREYWKANLFDGSDVGTTEEMNVTDLLYTITILSERLLDSVSDEKGP